MLTFFKNLMQLILSPAHGWEDIARSAEKVDKLRSSGLYPLTAITALSVFLQGIYHVDQGLSDLLIGAVVTFVMFFVGYFCGVFVLTTVMPGIQAPGTHTGERRINTLAIYSTGLLELIAIIANCVPITMALTLFLPLFVVVVIFKGARYLRVDPQYTARYVVLTSIALIAVPYLLKYLFDLALIRP